MHRDPIEVAQELRDARHAKEHFTQYLKREVFALNFYRLHMIYFVVVIAVSSVIMYGQGKRDGPREVRDAHLAYVDALFLACSAMTTTGLNTVDLGDLSGFQQGVMCVLLIIGNIPFVSTFVVLIRRWWFRKKMAEVVKHSRTIRRLVQDIEDHREVETRESNGNGLERTTGNKCKPSRKEKKKKDNKKGSEKIQPLSRRRTYHYQTGNGFFPTPWETKIARSFFERVFSGLASELQPEHHGYLSFKPRLDSKGRFLELSEHDRLELGGVEYRALQAMLFILIGYQVFWYSMGVLFLVPYAYRNDVKDILRQAQPGDMSPGWWAFFSIVSEFANGGLNVLNSNFVPFSGYLYILFVAGCIAFLGHTQFPIFLRLSIWILKKISPKNSRFRNTLSFLLHHPRRCFIYLFPSRETWYLFAIQITIDIAATLCFVILNIGMPDVESIPTGTRIVNGLFQASGLRTSGAYIISFSSLAPACLVAYIVIMYISSYPTVVTLRKTNTYEEASIGLMEGEASAVGVASHLQKQLAYDIWFQFLAYFLLCAIERGKINRQAPGFSPFTILFEVTSAYGTVGLSTGIPNHDYSLSADFSSLSKVVMMIVMLRGRHRGLPLAIDRSILLPGEELMRRMDHECGHPKRRSVIDGDDDNDDDNDDDMQVLSATIEASGTRHGEGETAAETQDPSEEGESSGRSTTTTKETAKAAAAEHVHFN